MSDSNTPIFLTIEEVAELLRLSERSVYSMARSGKLPGAAKVGQKWRVNRAALLAWMAEGGEREAAAGGVDG